MAQLLSFRGIVRLWGAVLLTGAIYIVWYREEWGWFTLPTVCLGTPAGLGMLLHRPFGRALGTLLFAYWTGFSLFVMWHGAALARSFVLLSSALVGLLVLWVWDERPAITVTVEYAGSED